VTWETDRGARFIFISFLSDKPCGFFPPKRGKKKKKMEGETLFWDIGRHGDHQKGGGSGHETAHVAGG